MSSVGNCRLKLLDMTLGSWFCKLKGMAKSPRNDGSKLKKTQPQQRKGGSQRSHRRSVPGMCYHFGRDDDPNSSVSPSDLKLSDTGYFPVPSPPRGSTRHRRTNPRKSRNKKPPRVVTSSLSAGCSCRATLDSVWAKTEQVSLHETELSVSPSSDFADYSSSSVEKPPQLPQSFDQMVSWSTSRSFGVNLNSNDIVIDLGETSLETDVELPLEKPLKFTDMVNNVRRPESASRTPSAKVMKEQTITVKDRVTGAKPGSIRGFAVNSPGVRLQLNSKSRRFRSRKRTQGSHRKISVPASQSSISGTADKRTSVPDSFAVIKSSADPRRDFRESMVEMIVENNIWAPKDLEELLACYLALNSDEYHDVIISVFKQLWSDLSDIRLK